MTKTTGATSNRPTHYLYAVTRREGAEKGHWVRIGAAWPNADARGYSFKFELLPVNGADVVMREPFEEGDAQ